MPSGKIRRYFSADDFKKTDRLNVKAGMIRFNTFQEIVVARSGHIGASFSCIEILTALYHSIMRPYDRFVLSKGHAAAALYATLASMGYMHENRLDTFRRIDGLQGHADIGLSRVHSNTGSLGMGISKAKGFAISHPDADSYVMVGDGELQEGQNWEAIMSAGHMHLGNLHLIVDRNLVQTDRCTEHVMGVMPLQAKLEAFGWHVEDVNGHDIREISRCFRRMKSITSMPKAIIAETTKGKGVSFMSYRSGDYKWHSGIPDDDEYMMAYHELYDGLHHALGKARAVIHIPDPVECHGEVDVFIGASMKEAFSESLVGVGIRNPNIRVMDCDLSEDCGLRPFETRFPKRFIECGIMEQDMVSTAGALARSGRLPIVNTYAAFLASRANEQIFNNCSEKDKVIYVGHLAGLLPGKPGKSHHGIRDISLLSAIPDLVMAAPCNGVELMAIMDMMIDRIDSPSYLRLEHSRPRIDITLPDGYAPVVGKGCVIAPGGDVTLVSYGPLMLSECMAARKLLGNAGIGAKIIAMPWLNNLDERWISDNISQSSAVVCVENHYHHGGLSAALSRIMKVATIGVEGWTQSGGNEELLVRHGLDYASIANKVKGVLV